jgi:hypothetical protein
MNRFEDLQGKSIMSDFELVSATLKKSKNLSAREIAIAVSDFGIRWDKGHANSVLYKMLAKELVEKDVSKGTRPIWNLPSDSHIKDDVNPTRLNVLSQKPKHDEFVALKAVNEYTINLNQNLIEFAVNEETSSNDPYIECDWLDDKIFVAINAKHPYIIRGVSNELILVEFLLFLAIDAFCEWRIIRDKDLMQVHSFIEIKDKILRSLN